MAIIKSKNEFYSLWKGLRLGNRIDIFETYDDFLKSGYKGLTSIRYRDAGSPYKAFHIPAELVPKKVEEFISQGANRDLFTFNESAPDDCLLIQGEAQYLVGGLHLTYSSEQCNMRKAMEQPLHCEGLRAHMLLRYYLNPKSLDMIRDLFELYPDCVIEFGAYDRKLGVIPGHNCIVWEIREY